MQLLSDAGTLELDRLFRFAWKWSAAQRMSAASHHGHLNAEECSVNIEAGGCDQ